jgi:alginate O-acetyltransferase complex protein AlgI
MLFNSVVFLFGFLPVAYVVFWSLRSTRSRHIWLAITGYVFYGYWNPWFTLLMLFSTLVSYFAGLGFLRWTDPRKRKLCLVIPVATDLALLGFFKYANFGLDTAEATLHLLGRNVQLPHLDIVLPIGISFYTFHTISYIVDSYRGTIKPTRSFPEFAAYVSLFSQLVAGPIVRFRTLEADLEALGETSRTRWLGKGIAFFIVGLVEKVIVADTIAAFVDPALARYDLLSTAGTWLAMLGYTFQLYFDFSGYSTMAVGLGLLFGLRIPQNFNSPYKSKDPQEFWSRWHISLSTCLRDYLYIPLGGNRHGKWQTYRNLMLTMLIGGLWHGASWTFVIWGAYHGALLSLHRAYGRPWDGLHAGVRQLGMFLMVLIGWVLFRATTFSMAMSIYHRMFVPTSGELVEQPVLAALVLCVAAWWAMIGPNEYELNLETTGPKRIALTAAFGASLAVIIGSPFSPFLYFQF